jgi:hypothetical protein
VEDTTNSAGIAQEDAAGSTSDQQPLVEYTGSRNNLLDTEDTPISIDDDNGNRTVAFADGSTFRYMADGSRMAELSDGKTYVVSPDGSSLETWPTGETITRFEDGSTVIETPKEGALVLGPDGRPKDYPPNEAFVLGIVIDPLYTLDRLARYAPESDTQD